MSSFLARPPTGSARPPGVGGRTSGDTGWVSDVDVDPVLAEIVERLVAALLPERIYLFGSKARGDFGPDSDYDLLVVVPESAADGRQGRRAYQALRGTGAAADVVVWSRPYFESRLHLAASLSATVAREGRLLYAA